MDSFGLERSIELLLVLALAGTLLFSAFRDKIEHWDA